MQAGNHLLKMVLGKQEIILIIAFLYISAPHFRSTPQDLEAISRFAAAAAAAAAISACQQRSKNQASLTYFYYM